MRADMEFGHEPDVALEPVASQSFGGGPAGGNDDTLEQLGEVFKSLDCAGHRLAEAVAPAFGRPEQALLADCIATLASAGAGIDAEGRAAEYAIHVKGEEPAFGHGNDATRTGA